MFAMRPIWVFYSRNQENSMLFGSSAILLNEHIALMKLTDTFDLMDAQSGRKIGTAKETPSGGVKAARLLISKSLMPTEYSLIAEGATSPLFRIGRSLVGARIMDGRGNKVFGFRYELKHARTLIINAAGSPVAYQKATKLIPFIETTLFTMDDCPIGMVTKKWAGLARELFTSADKYTAVLKMNPPPFPEALAILVGIALIRDASLER